MSLSLSRCSFVVTAVATVILVVASGCRSKQLPTPPVATPSLSLSKPKVPLGSPIDITYRFAVAGDARFDQDYRVMVHVLDSDDELIWTDDHNPSTPTTQWKPGQTVEYTRTVFVPTVPYVGEASVQVGLYSTSNQKRLTLSGEDMGQRAYRVARLTLQPQTENVFIVYKDGWHPAEVAEHNASVEWQWTKKDATLTFKNPKKDALLYLDVDNPGSVFREDQRVQLTLAGQPLDQFTVTPGERLLKKISVTAAQFGTGEMVELQIDVDKTFVPALLPASSNKDPRELGVRVFHAYIQPVS